jgi:hypothetical protein
MWQQKGSNRLPFDRQNWLLFGLGILVIIIGYILLRIPPAEGFWSLSAAPVVLVLGYCVLIPIALLKKPRHATRDAQGVERKRAPKEQGGG